MPQGKYTVKARFEIGAAKTIVAADASVAAGTITIPSHGYKTGDALGQVCTALVVTGVTTLTTPVYVIQVDTNTIKLATSRANAFAGTSAAITTAGAATFYKGGLGATLSGVIIPKDHYVVNARYLVHTTAASPTGVDNGTLAISLVAANDIVSAAAINSGTTWDDTGAQVVGIPLINTVSTYLLTTADSEVTFTTATDVWTAGKLDVFLDIVPALP